MASTDYEDIGGGAQLIFGETSAFVRVPVLVDDEGRLYVNIGGTSPDGTVTAGTLDGSGRLYVALGADAFSELLVELRQIIKHLEVITEVEFDGSE